MHRRVRAIHERLLVRRWEDRQRHGSKGVWLRLRRVLVDAERAFGVDDEDAAWLERRGRAALPVGAELHPRKRIFFVSGDELAALTSRSAVAVRLGADLLETRNLVLVPFASRAAAVLGDEPDRGSPPR